MDLTIADTRPEHERVVGRAVRADLAFIAEVLEHAAYGQQHRREGVASVVGLEDDRASEDDVLGHECDGGLVVAGLDGGTECMHRLDLTSR